MNTHPFVETRQCRELWEFCKRNQHSISVVAGHAGVGKSVAARHLANHLNASETMLYWLIARPEGETEQSVYNSLLASVSSQPVRQTAAFTELKRALRARRIVQVIADDAGTLSPRGIKAVETISDETGIGVTLITLPQGGVNALQGAAAFYEFSSLTIQQVQFEVLPKLAHQAGFAFDAHQNDADDIVTELVRYAGDSVSSTVNFAKLVALAKYVEDGVTGIKRAGEQRFARSGIAG